MGCPSALPKQYDAPAVQPLTKRRIAARRLCKKRPEQSGCAVFKTGKKGGAAAEEGGEVTFMIPGNKSKGQTARIGTNRARLRPPLILLIFVVLQRLLVYILFRFLNAITDSDQHATIRYESLNRTANPRRQRANDAFYTVTTIDCSGTSIVCDIGRVAGF